MTKAWTPSYQVAPGHDNAPNLRILEEIVVDGESFKPVTAYGSYDPGEVFIRGDGSVYVNGFPTLRWRISVVTRAQWRYLQTTYCGGNYSGQVTIRTDAEAPGTFSNFNATLILSKLTDMNPRQQCFTDFEMLFTRVTPI